MAETNSPQMVNSNTKQNIRDLWKANRGDYGRFTIPGHWCDGVLEWSFNDLQEKKNYTMDPDDINDIDLIQTYLKRKFTEAEELKTTDFNPDILTIEYVALKKSLRLPGSVATFKDNFAPKYNKENVYGRMDPIVTYQGTGRTMSLTWSVDITSTQSQTESILRALGDLAKFMYPVYQDANYNRLGTGTMVAPPVLRFRLDNAMGGNLGLMKNTLSSGGILGIVDSFTYLSFVTGLQGGEINVTRILDSKNDLKLIPTHAEVSFEITVLHETGKVGWVWNRQQGLAAPPLGTGGKSTDTISFAQGNDYPYGYGSNIDLSTLTPIDPAGSNPLAGAFSMLNNVELELSEQARTDLTAPAGSGLSQGEVAAFQAGYDAGRGSK
jgi:hypothetical protein